MVSTIFENLGRMLTNDREKPARYCGSSNGQKDNDPEQTPSTFARVPLQEVINNGHGGQKGRKRTSE
jgi:hypothetical protein